jgi:hypothetical protein
VDGLVSFWGDFWHVWLLDGPNLQIILFLHVCLAESHISTDHFKLECDVGDPIEHTSLVRIASVSSEYVWIDHTIYCQCVNPTKKFACDQSTTVLLDATPRLIFELWLPCWPQWQYHLCQFWLWSVQGFSFDEESYAYVTISRIYLAGTAHNTMYCTAAPTNAVTANACMQDVLFVLESDWIFPLSYF